MTTPTEVTSVTPSFMGSFRNVIDICLKAGFKKVLVGSGMAVSSFTIILSIFNYFLSKFLEMFTKIDPLYANFIGVMGFDIAFSTIISAYMIRLTLLTFKVSLIRGSNG